MSFPLLIALFVPFVLLPVVALAGRSLRAHSGWLALVAPLTAFALLLAIAGAREPGDQAVLSFPWVPSLDLGLTFMVDGLSLFFGLVVSGVGVLVVLYATFYLDGHAKHHGRFYSYLLLFMGAMLGTVFSGNLLLLFVFWELTGIASFLLIGFLHEKNESRDGARMALLVTASTGLAMLAGIVLLGETAGTYELAALMDGALAGKSPGTVSLAFVLIAVGALGKSAQFPFHFWLPNAMAAPTPVSAYLHSATMVKLGVFLVARIFPLFSGSELWAALLVPLCFGTMLLAAVLALLSNDLKAILAFSTVSQLGFLMGFYGLGSPQGVQGDLLHVSSHVFYKGCLFMVVGIVDHATGVRDVRKLGGLRHRLPILAVVALVAAASMAGLPGTLGFISKEYMLKEKFAYLAAGDLLSGFPLFAAVVASVVKVAFSARLFFGVFGGRETEAVSAHFHHPGLAMQLSPLLLGAGCLIFGVFPGMFGGMLDAFWTRGLHDPERLSLSLWHGVTKEFLLSMGIVAAGGGLYVLGKATAWTWTSVPRVLRFDGAFEAGVNALPKAAKGLGRALRFDAAFDYLVCVFGFMLLLLGAAVFAHRDALWPGLPGAADFDPLRSFVVALVGVALVMILAFRRWASQLIAVSIVGFLITFYYVLFRAPDLAMTQILVESATLLLVLLLLARFPRAMERSEVGRSFSAGRQALNISLAVGMGALTTLATLMAMRHRNTDPAGTFYLENTVPLAYGTNTVNTILVDFRGFDTLLEAAVLVIACLGALGLVMRYRRSAEEYASGAMGPAGYGLGRKGRKERS